MKKERCRHHTNNLTAHASNGYMRPIFPTVPVARGRGSAPIPWTLTPQGVCGHPLDPAAQQGAPAPGVAGSLLTADKISTDNRSLEG